LVNADSAKKAWAEEKLQQINEAYKTLKNWSFVIWSFGRLVVWVND
jgi:hypothetical protein